MFPPAGRTYSADFEKVARDSEPSFLDSTIKGSPLLLFVIYNTRKRAAASEGDVLGILSLGCAMENMWLMAESLGIGFQIMSTFTGDLIEKEVKQLLSIPDNMKISFACRLGYPLSPAFKYLRVRRDLADFSHHNQFGTRLKRSGPCDHYIINLVA